MLFDIVLMVSGLYVRCVVGGGRVEIRAARRRRFCFYWLSGRQLLDCLRAALGASGGTVDTRAGAPPQPRVSARVQRGHRKAPRAGQPTIASGLYPDGCICGVRITCGFAASGGTSNARRRLFCFARVACRCGTSSGDVACLLSVYGCRRKMHLSPPDPQSREFTLPLGLAAGSGSVVKAHPGGSERGAAGWSLRLVLLSQTMSAGSLQRWSTTTS